MDTKKKAINCFVSGRVQGVGFRMATSRQSKLLGLTGWVKNLDDGMMLRVKTARQNQQHQMLTLLQLKENS